MRVAHSTQLVLVQHVQFFCPLHFGRHVTLEAEGLVLKLADAAVQLPRRQQSKVFEATHNTEHEQSGEHCGE
jgi:hypothetical protein